MALPGANAWAQLAPDQTNGFGNGRLVTFTCLQNFDGSSGITSSRAMDAAEAAGSAVEVGSNFSMPGM